VNTQTGRSSVSISFGPHREGVIVSDLEKAVVPVLGPDTSQAVHPTLITEDWLTNPADAEAGDVVVGADRTTAEVRARYVAGERVLLDTDAGTVDADTIHETEHVVVVPGEQARERQNSHSDHRRLSHE
jgi:hypothetical protein